jgi:CubicO group peptidase (beta-lactamase class C family)
MILKTFITSVLASVSLLSFCQPINRIDGSKISVDSLNTRIDYLIEAANVAGVAVAIFNDGQLKYQHSFGYANLHKKILLSNKHVFYGASFSKAVFGYLVALLVVEGVIDLDTPLQSYLDRPLPEYEFEKEWRGYKNLKNDKRYETITARMCMNHTTGFPNWRWNTKENDFFPEGKIRFLVDPGSRYVYSGEGMQLLQFVIEQVTKKDLEHLAREKVFQPLNMNMTDYLWSEKFENKYCNGHTSKGEVIPKDISDEANAAGSMETTLEDYSKFVAHVLKLAGENSAITNLLFTPSVRIRSKTQFGYQGWQNTSENDSIALSYGLGWGILQSPYGKGVFKEGHGEGFQHYSILFPKKGTAVIILSNSDNAESIFKELLAISIGDSFTPWRWEGYIPYTLKETEQRN